METTSNVTPISRKYSPTKSSLLLLILIKIQPHKHRKEPKTPINFDMKNVFINLHSYTATKVAIIFIISFSVPHKKGGRSAKAEKGGCSSKEVKANISQRSATSILPFVIFKTLCFLQ